MKFASLVSILVTAFLGCSAQGSTITQVDLGNEPGSSEEKPEPYSYTSPPDTTGGTAAPSSPPPSGPDAGPAKPEASSPPPPVEEEVDASVPDPDPPLVADACVVTPQNQSGYTAALIVVGVTGDMRTCDACTAGECCYSVQQGVELCLPIF